MLYLIIGLTGALVIIVTLVHLRTRVLLHQERARIAALRSELDDLTHEARLSSSTAVSLLRFIDYLSDGLYEIHQIKPGTNHAKRLAISNQIRKRMEDRVRSLDGELPIVVIDGAFSIEPVIIAQLEAFKDKIQSKLDTADRYTPVAKGKGQRRNDYLIKRLVEGWDAQPTGMTIAEYCEKQNISERTFKRYQKEYKNRRIDLLGFFGVNGSEDA